MGQCWSVGGQQLEGESRIRRLELGGNRSTVRHTIISHPLRERHTLVRSQLPGSVVLGSDAGEPSLNGCYRLPAVAVLPESGLPVKQSLWDGSLRLGAY